MDRHGNPVRGTDEFGNPTTDAYGNPIGQQGYGHETAGMGTGGTAQMMHPEQRHHQQQQGYGHETGGIGTGIGGGTGGAFTHGGGGTGQVMHPERHHQEKGGILRRSGSSSSSSSEDDGMGGRRKKGLKEKIKEKLPGHQKTDEYGQPIQAQGHTAAGYGGTGTGTGTGGYQGTEKRGVVEKVKEKLPGGQKTDEYGQPIHGQGHTAGATAGYGGTGTDTAGYREPEKKGMMEKIKEKLPGGGH